MKKPSTRNVSANTLRAPGIGKALTPPPGKKLASFTVTPKFVKASPPKKNGR